MGLKKYLYHKGTCESEDIRAFKRLLTCNTNTLEVLVVIVICFSQKGGKYVVVAL